jgi:rSAM/selenodomain-associated transferase 1
VSAALLVIAKAPVPGRVKTRLSPPCTPEQAARLAAAALVDTLAAVAAAGGPARRRVLALDGEPGAWVPPGFEVVGQRAGPFGERLAGAFADVGGPALLVGMDTPQLTPALLEAGLAALAAPGVDAVLGPALDGGYWAIGLQGPDPAVFEGVPMSVAGTGEAQRARLGALGLRTADLPPLLDVDTIEDARVVAAGAPDTAFAAALAELGAELVPRAAA